MFDEGIGPEGKNEGIDECLYVRSSLGDLIDQARKSKHFFLIYLLGMAMQELENIERGEPTLIE
ncbi:hypothetical protein NAC44_20380 [Allorhizobium sp. BGMRC 0089]|uniref:hypothetical protein n=1 Tax=Allorhizobium sonneratiae TaxID=2934936 RepID=UPI0020343909|nr:hypothetical protein [Allorhizobium sonneratiae]MCM2294688.1 hypothetical protein [Allorhizobium sonneratiae]